MVLKVSTVRQYRAALQKIVRTSASDSG